MTWRKTLLATFFLGTVSMQAAIEVSEIELRADPLEARLRPSENLVVQLLVYGRVYQEGESRRVRIRAGDADFRIVTPQGGWLSKPFRYQGPEQEPFYEEEQAGLASILLGRASSTFVLQDSVLYTAPSQAGSYRIEATLKGKKAWLEVEVDRQAPSLRRAETTSFEAGTREQGPYRDLAEHYSPFVAQETWFGPKYDYLTRFDFDGDWRGDNNWDSADSGTSQAYVYYAAVETQTHWFLIYNLFHPRDYSDKCVAGTCHENDNEGLILTIHKDGSQYGRLQVMETLAHNNIYSYRLDRNVKKKTHNIDGRIELHEGSHPVVFIEAGGHGVYGSTGRHSRYSLDSDRFSAGTGVTYVYRGRTERPEHANDREVGYELLPIFEHWWLRAVRETGQSETFAAYYTYQPMGGRPRPAAPQIAGAFLGRKMGSNKAKPFWGWHDERTRKKKVLSTGQWGLDPAYSVSQNLKMPKPFSLTYLFNPYLGVGQPDSSGPGSETAVSVPAVPMAPTGDSQQAGLPGTRLSPTEDTPASNRDKNEGNLDFQGRIDGTVIFRIRGEEVFVETVSGRPVGVKRLSFSQPLPRTPPLSRVELRKGDGRGKITLLEHPWEGNQFVAVIRISDPKGGDDNYRFQLKWRR